MLHRRKAMERMSLVLLVIFSLISVNEGARILGIFPNDGYSQYLLGSTIMKELAARGHEVTIITPFTEKNPIANYKEIVIKVERPGKSGTLYNLESLSVYHSIMTFYDKVGLFITENALKDNKVQELLHSDATFDLVISELFINEAHLGFAHHFRAPLVLFCSMGAIEWANHLVANPTLFSHVPNTLIGFTDHMTFWERLQNSAVGLFEVIYKHLVIFPKHNELLKKYFPNAPDLKDIMYKASLILLNSDVTTNAPMAHVPNMIEIGGFHVSPKKLPKELQEFLDNARDGVVFFSMGSNLRSHDLSAEKRDVILRVFSKLKQKVLWKFEDENLPGKPANVKIGEWFPQQDVLAHPNIRAFITHGGLLSATEAIYSGVPMIVIPIFGDQKMNAGIGVANGFVVRLPFQELNEEKFSAALNEILTNTSYREAARRRSQILKDHPIKPMDRAMFWIEYVLRHQGASHLRTAALNLHWYQYFLLDVIAFVVIVTIGIFVFCKMILCKIFSCDRTKRSNNKKED